MDSLFFIAHEFPLALHVDIVNFIYHLVKVEDKLNMMIIQFRHVSTLHVSHLSFSFSSCKTKNFRKNKDNEKEGQTILKNMLN